MTQVTVSDFLTRWPNLKRVGQEWQGPCPNCGGRDRFHLRTRGDGFALFGCRGCIDEKSRDQRRDSFRRIMTRLEFDKMKYGFQNIDTGSSFRKKSVYPDHQEQEAITLSWLATIWLKGIGVESSPAGRYLSNRNCLPPAACKYNRTPMDIRWLSERDFAELERTRPATVIWTWPRAAGCLMCALRTGHGHLKAISFEGLTGHGQLLRKRWRKTLGKRKGSWFQPWKGKRGTIIAEGECDALSLGWQYPGHTVIGGGGTGLLKNRDLAVWLGHGKMPKPHIIITDGDDAARKAGRQLWQTLYEMGLFSRLEFCPEGEDPASSWEHIIDKARNRTESMVDAWHSVYLEEQGNA